MGFIKGLLIFTANMALVIIMIRFITLVLEKIGVFKAMERLFGKNQEQAQGNYKDEGDKPEDDVNDE